MVTRRYQKNTKVLQMSLEKDIHRQIKVRAAQLGITMPTYVEFLVVSMEWRIFGAMSKFDKPTPKVNVVEILRGLLRNDARISQDTAGRPQ